MNNHLEGLLNFILKKIEESRQYDPFLSRWKYKLPDTTKSMTRKTKDDVFTFFIVHELVSSFEGEEVKTYDPRNEAHTSTKTWLLVEYEHFPPKGDPEKRQHNTPLSEYYLIK